MGLRLIAYAGSHETLPELADGKNALIGLSPQELAILVRRACLDGELNRKLQRGGRAAYKEILSPTALSRKLAALMGGVIPWRGYMVAIRRAT